MIEDLCEQIWNREGFRTDYRQLLRASVSASIGLSVEPMTGSATRLLASAAHFSLSNQDLFRDAAFRIAIHLRDFKPDLDSSSSSIVGLVLSRLGNLPTLDLIGLLSDEQSRTSLPLPAWLQVESRIMRNSVSIARDARLYLTDFQRNIWSALEEGDSVSVSAPTSAGKSFTLQRFITDRATREESFSVLYLVPTRALISEVSHSLARVLKAFEIKAAVTSVPVLLDSQEHRRQIYVLTQERAESLLKEEHSLRFDLVIVDEAQGVAKDNRGILLQHVIEEILRRRSSTQILFGSPLTDNPEILGSMFGIEELASIATTESPVTQNLVFADVDDFFSTKLHLSTSPAVATGNLQTSSRVELAEIDLPLGVIDKQRTLAIVSHTLGRDSQSIVYGSSPAACEDITNYLVQLAADDESRTDELDDELTGFIDLVKNQVHPQFYLATALRYGCAFHYANIPQIIRKGVEDLFSQGKIRFLICTSTLLQGVNSPAKNIFMLDPGSGGEWLKNDEPLSGPDFWNLAGRAGRLGSEFQGNVFLINLEQWRKNPLNEKRTSEIRPSLIRTLTEEGDSFIQFVQDVEHRSGDIPAYERAFARLYADHRRGILPETLATIEALSGQTISPEIQQAISNALVDDDLPTEVIERNLDISPIRQSELFQYMQQRLKERGAEYLMPLHPRGEFKPSLDRLTAILRRISYRVEKRTPYRLGYFASLALRWMRGEPLASLIENELAYKRSQAKRGQPNPATVIREVMGHVENVVRFRMVKNLRLYLDVLRAVLSQAGETRLAESVPAIPLYLELGASSGTMVSLIGLGVSRTTATLISSKLLDMEMSRERVVEVLRSGVVDLTGLPPVCARELESIIG